MMRQLLRRVQRRFRAARMRGFETGFRVAATTRILDVGGTPGNWELMSVQPRVTLLNNEQEPVDRSTVPGHFAYVVADARALPFADDAFDLVYSNSVIEHVGSANDQERMAGEVRRVGRGYHVQTPNRWFPVEPHIVTEAGVWRPLVHYLPRAWQHALMPSWYRRIRLLGRRDFGGMFPDGAVESERVGGLSKSFIATRHP